MTKKNLLFPPILALSLLISLFFLLSYLPQTASAAGTTRYVAPGANCGTASPCYATIQEAVDASSNEDEILIAQGTYTGVSGRPRADIVTTGLVTQVVYIDKSLSITGGYSTAWGDPDPQLYPTIVDAQENGRGIYILEGLKLELANLTITGGDASMQGGDPAPNEMDAGGGIYVYKSEVSLNNCLLEGNIGGRSSWLSAGGGMYIYESSAITLTANTFQDNKGSAGSRYGYGGAVAAFNSGVILNSNIISGNIAARVSGGYGGGVHFVGGVIRLDDNDITNNVASTSGGSTHVGHGGGLFAEQGSVTLLNNDIMNNRGGTSGFASGGGLRFDDVNLSMVGNQVIGNIGSQYHHADGGGIFIDGGDVMLITNEILSNTSSTGVYGNGGGMYIQVADRAELVGNTIAGNHCSVDESGSGGGLRVEATRLIMTDNLVKGNTAGINSYGRGGGVYLHIGNVDLARNTIVNNTAAVQPSAAGDGGGIYVSSVTFTMTNNIVADNHANVRGSGFFIQFPGIGSHLLHNTIADNSGVGEGVYYNNINHPIYTLAFSNTIIAGHASAGITATSGSIAAIDSTLWYGNIQNAAGDGLITQNDHSGNPVFVNPASWDYHISVSSAAIDQGVDAGVALDIDKQARPAGSGPDIGADEFMIGPTASAEKIAFTPQWIAGFDHESSLASNYLEQRYMIAFQHSGSASLQFTIQDILPNNLDFQWGWFVPSMEFSQAGNTLEWTTIPALPSDSPAQVVFYTMGEDVDPGTTIKNTANVAGGSWDFDLKASSEVPLFPPVIVEPGSGEICTQPVHIIEGLAMPDEIVKIYQNDNEIDTVNVDVNGVFTATLSSIQFTAGNISKLDAKTCLKSDPTTCSNKGEPVTMRPHTSFFCPQVSTWTNYPDTGPLAGQDVVHRFRDRTGKFVSNGWELDPSTNFNNSDLHLYILSCPAWTGSTGAPDAVWVEIEDEGIFNPTSSAHPWYEFNISTDLPRGAYETSLNIQCLPPGTSNRPTADLSSTGEAATFMIGTVFDVTQGFDPGDPGAHGVPGITVTLMVSMTEWGGWVPWPAHLHGDQQNPQITSAEGAYQFNAPADLYYLSMDGKQGYQPWHSPVFTDVTQIQAPLTPSSQGSSTQVSLTPSGPNPSEVTVNIGERVVWSVPLDFAPSLLDRMQLTDNPTIRLLSDNDPLSFTTGWDSGLLVPGGKFLRVFDTPGEYTYQDGLGNSAKVIVDNNWLLFLPLLSK